jgi:hypothetical protein
VVKELETIQLVVQGGLAAEEEQAQDLHLVLLVGQEILEDITQQKAIMVEQELQVLLITLEAAAGQVLLGVPQSATVVMELPQQFQA